MGTFKKIQDFILPEEVDFFKRLEEQSSLAKNIIDEMYNTYITQISSSKSKLEKLMIQAEEVRKKNLKELYQVFITPVDNEAISRAYINLDWVVMSVKHLKVELEIFEIEDLKDFKIMIDLLKGSMNDIHVGFGMLHKKEFENFSETVFNIIHNDNQVVKEYARLVSNLLNNSDIKTIIKRKEILAQLKEISKRIRICANDLEDMLFKMK